MSTEITQPIYKVPIWLFDFISTLGKPAQGIGESHFLIEGKNKIEARLQLTKEPNFWKNYDKASLEERKKMRPFKLRREGKIEKILDCKLRYKNHKGEYTCGRPIYSMEDSLQKELFNLEKSSESFNENGEFGMCYIEGCDSFDIDDCPYND